MKKFVSVILTLMLTILTFSISAGGVSNELSVEKSFEFNNSDFSDKLQKEIFEEKLAITQLPKKFYSILPQKAYDKIIVADSIKLSSSYYVESDDGGELIQTNKANYESVVAKEQKRIEQAEQCILSFDTKNNFANSYTKGLIGSPGASETINKGTLNIIMLLASSDDENYYMCAIFNWETMPSARYTDAFGITRGENSNVIPHSAEGGYSLTYNRINLSGTSEVISEHEDIVEFDYNDLKKSPDGYAMEIELHRDATAAALGTSIIYKEAMGVIGYEGVVNSTAATSINHWATYAHKRLNLVLNEVNFSISFKNGFDIGGLLGIDITYKQLVDEHLWII